MAQRCQGLGFSGGDGAAPRRTTDSNAPPGTSNDDAPETDGQAVTGLPKWTSGGDAPMATATLPRRAGSKRWPRGKQVTPAVARGAVVSGDGGHARRGWLWRPSTTNSSDPVASAASFDLAASGSSFGDELSDHVYTIDDYVLCLLLTLFMHSSDDFYDDEYDFMLP